MIKAIIFDIGGVILDMSPLALPLKDVFEPEDVAAFWQELNLKFTPLCRGEGTLYEFWKGITKELGKDIPDSVLKKLWMEDFEKCLIINEEVKEIIISLKKNYKLAIISNVIPEHAGLLKNNKTFRELLKIFDKVIFSNEVKMSKDSRDIFLLALRQLNLKPEECVFTDDVKKFVDVAKSLGINAVQFRNALQFREELVKHGVKL